MINEIVEQVGILSPLLMLGLGLVVGIQHAFEPDHVAAVSTQISKSKLKKISTKQLIQESITKSSILGVAWGAGHTTTLVLIGFLVYVLAISIQNQIFSGFEFVVGLMLVFLGITTILNKKIQLKHKHPHQHKDGTIHLEEHNHSDTNHKHSHKSYIIGLIHGLAGSGSLVVLTAITFDNVGLMLGFIVIFGVGSIIGMTFVGSLIGLPLAFGNRTELIRKIFRYIAGTLSLVIGFNIMYQIGLL
jgi:hypothetical protein